MFRSGPPTDATVPPGVLAAVGDASLRVVWRNELGGLTFAVATPGDRRFVKWSPAGCGIDLGREAERLRWAAPFTPVPAVLAEGEDGTGQWMITRAIDGESAVSDRWRRDPATAVRAIGEGLRAMHDRLPVEDCPFSWSAADRVSDARRRAATGELDPTRWHKVHQNLSLSEALSAIAWPPAVDRLVVCHGDACAPNTLLDDSGRWTAHVDLGSLGVADRWADLAVATWSTEWNYGPGWTDALLSAYGVRPDPARIAYYRLLWDLGP